MLGAKKLKKIYSTNNFAEAYMVRDLLEQYGITVSVQGENAHSQFGEPITIWIDDDAYEEEAKKVISKIIDNQSCSKNPYRNSTRATSKSTPRLDLPNNLLQRMSLTRRL